MSARDRTNALACSHEPENIPDNWPQVAACGGELSGMTRDTLSDKAIRAALKKTAVAGKPATINDGDGLSLIARPDGAGWWRLRYWLASRKIGYRLATTRRFRCPMLESGETKPGDLSRPAPTRASSAKPTRPPMP